MSADNFFQWCKELHKTTYAKRWRSLVVLSGESDWQKNIIESGFSRYCEYISQIETPLKGLLYDESNGFVIPQHQELLFQNVNHKNYVQHLGTEQNIIIFSATTAFDANAFAALSGTLVKGGILLLLMPNEHTSDVSPFSGNFGQRFWQMINNEQTYVIRQDVTALHERLLVNTKKLGTEFVDPHRNKIDHKLDYHCLTQEQVTAVRAMLNVFSGHRNRPLVLTADRGRGKSSALALAACEILRCTAQRVNIIITATSRHSLNVFFSLIVKTLPNAQLQGNKIVYEQSEVEFLPIDHILRETPTTSLLMVDEAAAIPIYLLEKLLLNYHRLIFASTVHGYEGAGRGFTVKFQTALKQHMPQWRNLHIQEPIRWADTDPLERFVFKACLLDANLLRYEDNIAVNWRVSSLSVQTISKIELIQNEELLQQTFSILVTAHYQTSPNDLMLLLDNKAISLLVLKHDNALVGVAMLMAEGQIDEELVTQINQNKRRLRDQFIPQSLLTHCAVDDSFKYSYQRVMRVAIHPKLHGLGGGHYFLSAIEKTSKEQGFDFVGSSFAGNAQLIKFWLRSKFSIARIGFNKDKASGEHSCLMIKALSPNSQVLEKNIAANFYQQFDYWLTDEFKMLPAQFVWQILNASSHHKVIRLGENNLHDIEAFIVNKRQFSQCVYSLHYWLLLDCLEAYNPSVLPLISRIFQKQSIETVCSLYGFTGKKSLNQHIVDYISERYNQLD